MSFIADEAAKNVAQAKRAAGAPQRQGGITFCTMPTLAAFVLCRFVASSESNDWLADPSPRAQL